MNSLYTISLVVLGCGFLTSCNSYFRASAPDLESFENKRQVDVMKIHTSTEGLVYFSSKYPGKLTDGEITGVKQVPLQFFSADSVAYKIRGIKEIPVYAYADGKKLDVFKHNNLNLVYTSTLINVPVAEVSNLELKKKGHRKLIFSGLVVGMSALSVYIISNMTLNVGDSF
jgi:hypothetical protein